MGEGEKKGKPCIKFLCINVCVWLNICLCMCVCACVSEWVMISIVYHRKGGGQVEKL